MITSNKIASANIHDRVAIGNIERLSLSIDTSVKESSQQLDELTKGFDSYKLGTVRTIYLEL